MAVHTGISAESIVRGIGAIGNIVEDPAGTKYI